MVGTVIVNTRMRDVPFDDLVCKNKNFSREVWNRHRGQPIQIVTPARPRDDIQSANCQGPYFEIYPTVVRDGLIVCVCPHAAEIGD